MLKKIRKFFTAVKIYGVKVKNLTSFILKNTLYSKKGINYFLRLTLIVSVAVTSVVITSGFTKNNALAVYINDKAVGILDNTDITETKLYSKIQTKINAQNNTNTSINEKITLVPVIASSSETSSEYEILNSVVNDISYSVNSYNISVNGEKVACLKTSSEAESVLENIKNSRIAASSDIVSVNFTDDVKISEEYVPSEELMTYDDAYKALSKNISDKKTYTIVKGDTIEKIADKTNLSVDEICKLNPGLDEDTILQIGDEIKILEEKPFLSIETVKKVSYTKEIPYKTKEIKNNEEYKTYKKVIKEGKEGEKEITDEVTYENGKEVERKTIKETILSIPEEEEVEVGTLQTPVKKATGIFKMPVSGVLTSGFGSRWGTVHKGIDLGAPAGTPVHASDGGVVTFAGWNNGGYGYLVKISHENGLETYYAHNSKVAVSAGDRVYQGQVIAYVGSTGDSTGNHLHFEVRENGFAKNPYTYLQ